MAVKPGDILRDKFRIDSVIGRGGMGQVFAATSLQDRTQVAIKVVSRLLVDDVLMVRLHREAEAATRIRSDFVPRVLEVSDTDEGETFLVMERLVGESLSQRIRERGALPWSEVRRIGEDILHGLIDAHTAGVVHRDLKPSNVFLTQKDAKPRAMVLDFGVCKLDGVDAERLTGTGESIGTVAYMAPEQIRGAARVDERADLYAFGVLVFELLSGRLPHEGPSQMAILASKLEKGAASLRSVSRVAMPDGVDELVGRLLQRDPARRFPNAQELIKAWRALANVTKSIPPGDPRPLERDPHAAEPPTEVSRPSSGLFTASEGLPGAPRLPSIDDIVIEPPARMPSSPEPHPTQTALTTHHTSIHRKGSGARVALVLAAVSLVAGVVAVSASLTRGSPSPRPSVVAVSDTAAATRAAPEAPTVAVEIASSAPVDSSSFELPEEDSSESASAGEPAQPAPSASHSRRRKKPAPKSSGPHITTQPRY